MFPPSDPETPALRSLGILRLLLRLPGSHLPCGAWNAHNRLAPEDYQEGNSRRLGSC